MQPSTPSPQVSLSIRRLARRPHSHDEHCEPLLLAHIDDKPHELLITAMVRAKMCEQLARLMQQGTVLPFSSLASLCPGRLYGPPDARHPPGTSLADEIVRPCWPTRGMLGATLHCVLAYEQGDWGQCIISDARVDLLVKTYLEALMWATEMHNIFKFLPGSWGIPDRSL